MNACIFCEKISDGSLARTTIYEDEQFIAFLDSNPLAVGHTQLIPKAHVAWVWEYEAPGTFFEVATKIVKHLRIQLAVEKIDMLISGGSVPHAHMHIVPSAGKWLDVLEEIRFLRKSLTDDEKAIGDDMVASLRFHT